MRSLSVVETLAISRVFDARSTRMERVREQVLPGKYNIDVTVRVRGEVTVGADYVGAVVQKAEPWKLLTVLMDSVDETTLQALVEQATKLDDDAVEGVKERVKAALAAIKSKTDGPCKGKVTHRLACDLLDLTTADYEADLARLAEGDAPLGLKNDPGPAPTTPAPAKKRRSPRNEESPQQTVLFPR